MVTGKNFPGACATRNFTYLVRGPWQGIRWPWKEMTLCSHRRKGWIQHPEPDIIHEVQLERNCTTAPNVTSAYTIEIPLFFIWRLQDDLWKTEKSLCFNASMQLQYVHLKLLYFPTAENRMMLSYKTSQEFCTWRAVLSPVPWVVIGWFIYIF